MTKRSGISSINEARWTCDHCGQTVEPFHDQTVGRYIRRQYCPCEAGQAKKDADEAEQSRQSENQRIEAALARAGLIRGLYARFTMGTFDPLRMPPASTRAREKALQYIAEVAYTPGGKTWLSLFGDYGLGKTHLAVAILRKIVELTLWSAHVVNWTSLCQATKESWHSTHGPTEAQLWGRARGVKLLLIDDLDKTSTSEWAMGKLYDLINYRYMEGKPTIITSNLDLLQLREDWGNSDKEHVRDLGSAVISRIRECLWGGIYLEGEDQRWVGDS